MNRPGRFLPALALATLAIVHVTGLGLGVAAAHEGDGVLVVESQGPPNGLSFPYVIRLTWKNDGHTAVDATVTATAISADGTPQTPVPMEPVDQDGRYAATLTYPSGGTWTVRFTAVTPAATTEVAEAVTQPTTTSTAVTTESTTTTEANTTPTEAASTEDDPDDDSGLSTGGVLAALFLGLVVVGCAVGFARSARRLREDR